MCLILIDLNLLSTFFFKIRRFKLKNQDFWFVMKKKNWNTGHTEPSFLEVELSSRVRGVAL